MPGEKTEPPTPKKIRDAHKKGNFLFSKEVVSTATLLAALLMLSVGHSFFTKPLYQLIAYSADAATQPFEQSFGRIIRLSVEVVARAALLVYASVILASIAANMAQVGLVFSGAKLTKGFKALDAVNNAKQMFAKKNLFSLLMNIVKVAVIGTAVYLLLINRLVEFVRSPYCGFLCIMQLGISTIFTLAFISLAVYFPIAALDYLVQRHFYMKELRMSIEEIKEEFKQTEGSPDIKAQRRQIHQEILNSRTIDSVKKSTAVITNPTKVAVAIYYDENETPLPKVMAKGSDGLAKLIKKVAEDEGIPIYESIDLARSMNEVLEVGAFITSEFIDPVAEVLLYIKNLEQE